MREGGLGAVSGTGVQQEATRALLFPLSATQGLPLNYSNCLLIKKKKKKKQAAAFEVGFRGVPTFSGRMS